MAVARTNWRFYVGGMYAKEYTEVGTINYKNPLEKTGTYNIMAGMDIQFSLKEKFYIETGLNYRYAPYAQWEDEDSWNPLSDYRYLYGGHMHLLSVPVRFGYRLRMNENNSFEFGVGPYVALRADGETQVSVGLSPVVTYKHRALSLSLRYENPVFYDGMRNELKNQFAFTIGVNFNGRSPNWDNIALGLEAAGSVLGTATEVMNTYYQSTNQEYSGSSESYSTGDSSNSGSSGSVNDSSAGLSLSDARNLQRDRTTYFQMETNLIKALNGEDTSTSVSTYRQRMKSLREKWEKRGHGWQKSRYE